MSFKSKKDLDIQFQGIIPGDSGEGSYCHKFGLVELDSHTGNAIRCFLHSDSEVGSWILGCAKVIGTRTGPFDLDSSTSMSR